MAPLNRAVARMQVQGRAKIIGKDLNLHMPWLGQVPLEQHPLIAKSSLGFPSRPFKLGRKIRTVHDRAHTFAATASTRLDQHRKPDLISRRNQGGVILADTVIARHDWNACCRHQALALRLAPHGTDRRGGRSNKDDPGIHAGFSEIRVFRQKPVSWMDRLRSGEPCCLKSTIDPQIAIAGTRWANGKRDISKTHMLRMRIGFRKYRDAANAKATRSADNPAGDLATIGDEQGLKHRATSGTGRSAWLPAEPLPPRRDPGQAHRASRPGL